MGIQITREQCRSIIRRTIEGNDWQLTLNNEKEFLDEVFNEALKRAMEKEGLSVEDIITEAVINRYCHRWHRACMRNGYPIQDRALRELGILMYPTAFRIVKNDQIAEDAVQQALINVWKNLDQIEDLGSFIEWARAIVAREALKKVYKTKKRGQSSRSYEDNEILQTDLGFADEKDQDKLLSGLIQQTLNRHEPTMHYMIVEELKVAIRACLRNYNQQEAIIRCILNGTEHSVVAADLGITPESLSVLKGRAIHNLRKSKRFLAVINDAFPKS